MKDHVARIRIIVDISLCASFETLGRDSTYGPSRRSEGARCFVKDTTGSVWVCVPRTCLRDYNDQRKLAGVVRVVYKKAQSWLAFVRPNVAANQARIWLT